LASVAAIDSNQVAKGDPPLDFQAYFDPLLSAAVQHEKRNQLFCEEESQDAHIINYLDMDFQDYEFLTGPSTGDYEDGCLDGIEVHRTFQMPSRSQQPFRTFQPPRN